MEWIVGFINFLVWGGFIVIALNDNEFKGKY